MNAAQLWNDHTFRVLLEDLFKARKDETMGPLRLEAIFRYVEGTQPVPTGGPGPQPPPKKLIDPRKEIREQEFITAPVDGPSGAFVLEEDPAPLEAPVQEAPGKPVTAKGYLQDRLDERKARSQQGLAALSAAADILQAAIQDRAGWDGEGNKQVPLPKGTLVAGLEKMLRERNLPFTAIAFSMPPRQQAIPKAVEGMTLEAAQRVSGGQGERSTGIMAVISR